MAQWQCVSPLNAIDETCDIYSLLDLNLVSSAFLELYVKDGTIKSYLTSLRHLYTFLLSDRPRDLHFNVDGVSAARQKSLEYVIQKGNVYTTMGKTYERPVKPLESFRSRYPGL